MLPDTSSDSKENRLPVQDFMIQAGDPTGTGRGGESIYGKSFEVGLSLPGNLLV